MGLFLYFVMTWKNMVLFTNLSKLRNVWTSFYSGTLISHYSLTEESPVALSDQITITINE